MPGRPTGWVVARAAGSLDLGEEVRPANVAARCEKPAESAVRRLASGTNDFDKRSFPSHLQDNCRLA
jgi:hypothetical protein